MAKRGMSEAAVRYSATLTLPLFLTPKNKYPVAVLASIFAASLYLASNHLNFFEPRYLPLTRFDRSIPFIPHTVWIYVTDLLLFYATYIYCRSLETANKYLYAFLSLQVASCAIFWLWPTTYPRELFPLPADLDGLTAALFSQLRIADSPANCAPSLHVSSCYLSAFMFRDNDRGRYGLWLVWSTLIALSTLTTKQHYIVDVILGFFFGAAFYWIFVKWVIYREIDVPGAQANR